MTPTRREQIMALLDKYNVSYQKYPTRAYLADDLAALFPPVPSREGLEKLLESYQGFTHCCFGKYHGICQKCMQLVESLLTWAQGTASAPTWCEHCKFVDGQWKFYLFSMNAADYSFVISNWWDICPMKDCHARRPTETP